MIRKAGDATPEDRPWEQQIWDHGLQPERTKLAWQRTALSATACSLVVARMVGQTHPVVGIVVAAVAILCGAGIARTARRRHWRVVRAVHREDLLPDARSSGWLTALIVATGLGAVALAVIPFLS
ncbi:MAG TPA: DUF202 domain-containing protein [Candidatus Avipropionibacterium avicola]|uniref:DUF202 domain-containing protein n=1 Tax=Candidatus Avipropionibacterium avicola TaxID=2840701 RepID=A0A9D1KPG7_9ACTN|nr:DUF202 domain-containing protein [Candidatus Avipropionibacterium avicola]